MMKVMQLCFGIPALTALSAEASPVLYQNDSSQLEIARHPLSAGAVDISLRQPRLIHQLEEKSFSDIWEARFIAEKHFSEAGYDNRLCYTKWESGIAPKWHVVPYPSLPLPSYLDNFVTKKIYSVWLQAAVLFRTVFPGSGLSESAIERERAFWDSSLLPEVRYEGGEKTGRGALTNEDVVRKQMVYADTDSEILLLYNYAPLRTGGEQMHFLLASKATNPARNFLELDRRQYLEVLALTRKVALWAEKEFGKQAVVHVFDKTGEVAGQTQPLYHAHLIILKEESEETWGKVAMFFRMLLPARSLPSDELERRVVHYRNTLGKFLVRQDQD